MTRYDAMTRRALVGGGLGMLAGGSALGQATKLLVPTSEQELGPFFPIARPLDQDHDLTRVKGSAGVAKGPIIEVMGQVLDVNGRPVPRARIDLWQANALGRYRHPGDMRADAPLDPNFQGSAVIVADDSGHYRFRTVKPGSYPIGEGRVRTPHIHADVMSRNERLTTQMYFPNEPLNAKDILFPGALDKNSVTAHALGPLPGEAAAVGYRWDIVLAFG